MLGNNWGRVFQWLISSLHKIRRLYSTSLNSAAARSKECEREGCGDVRIPIFEWKGGKGENMMRWRHEYLGAHHIFRRKTSVFFARKSRLCIYWARRVEIKFQKAARKFQVSGSFYSSRWHSYIESEKPEWEEDTRMNKNMAYTYTTFVKISSDLNIHVW